jgi:sigma-E factor negative regulatory protein RseB
VIAKQALAAWLLALSIGAASAPALAQQPAATAPADDASPLLWLGRMNEALATRNYDGVFFHVREGRVETLRILHGVDNGTVRERLVSMDGSGREFVRQGDELICYLPDQRTVLVEPRPGGASLLGALPNAAAASSEHYELTQQGRARLMGRDARVIEIKPRDEFRFGYRLWIDEATAMPLKSQLCDAGGRVLEQVVFARLTLPARIAADAFKLPAAADSFRWVRPEPASGAAFAAANTAVGPETDSNLQLWNVMRLPPGFKLTTRQTQLLPGATQPATHLVFSDGFASVSVFVEAPRESSTPAPAGGTQMGLSSAYSLRRSGVQITAVGEVPLATVQYFATQVRAGGESEQAPPARYPGGRSLPRGVPQGVPALVPRAPPRP